MEDHAIFYIADINAFPTLLLTLGKDSACHTERRKANREGRARATYYGCYTVADECGCGPNTDDNKKEKVVFRILGSWLVLFIYVLYLYGSGARHIKPKAC